MTVPAAVTERIVLSGTAALAVYERGTADPSRPTVVLAHGWPDTAAVWDLVADRLAAAHHVVTYDTRGVGRSTPASTHRPYTLDKLADDLGAVISAVSPDRPVHLAGHDWGSVTGWEFVVRPEAGERVASFTSLSGPNLDYVGAAIRRRLRRPTPRSLAPVLAQGAKSAYTLALSTPGLRTGIWHLGFGRLFRRWLRISEGIRAEDGYPGPEVAAAAIGGVPVYRSNLLRKLRRPDPRPAVVPVQLLVVTHDRYLSRRMVTDVDGWVADLTVAELDAGHWTPRTHPDAVAGHVAGHVAAIDARTVGRTTA